MGGAFGQHHRIIGGPVMGTLKVLGTEPASGAAGAHSNESEDKSLGGSLGKVFLRRGV